jgi:hypothetical protein
MGRFLIPDWSAKVEPIPYSKLDDPQSLNLYAYMRNNPLGGVDVDGHFGNGPDRFGCSEGQQDCNTAQQKKAQKQKPGVPDHLVQGETTKFPHEEAIVPYQVVDEHGKPTGAGDTNTEHVTVTEAVHATVDIHTSHDLPIPKNSIIHDIIGPDTPLHEEPPGTYYSVKTLQTFTVSDGVHTYVLTTKVQQFVQVQDGKVTQAGATVLVP